jgi:mono/diheme cytochrome c family protein
MRKLLLLVVAFTPWMPAAAPGQGGGKVGYNRDVRPILSENCFACHGPDSAARKADLRLDRPEDALAERDGYATIVPGEPDESELMLRVEAEGDDPGLMPPVNSHKKLTTEQKATLRKWIAEGAEYEPHWAFIPPTTPAPPVVANEGWARNAIDRFVLAKLEAAGLAPNEEADRRTLIRRVSLDLTGLPPEPAEVEAFVNDPDPDAYEKLVDRLLQSPRWGEHRARAWLDAARYADTHGYHFDNFREMWTYRDWVIDAFNKNMPFDRFATEQLAGDLLPNATLDQQIASGFNRCNMTTNEGGTIPEENLVIYMKDRAETASAVFLGLTANCAGCHDHKYDPISQKEYYQLAAFFNNTTQGAMDGNIRDTPPILFVPADEDRDRWGALKTELAEARAKVDERRAAARPDFDAWLATQSPDAIAAMAPREGLEVTARLGARGDGPDAVAPNGPAGPALELASAGDYEKDQGFTVALWVRPEKGDLAGALVARMDDAADFRGWDVWAEGGRVGMHIINKWPDDAMKVTTDAALPAGRWTHVVARYDGSGKPGGISVFFDGKLQQSGVRQAGLKGSIKTAVPLKVGQRSNSSKVTEAKVSELRVYSRSLADADVAALAGASRLLDLVSRPADQRPAADLDAAYGWWLEAHDPASRELVARRTTLEQEEGALKARGSIAHVMAEKPEPAMAYVLFRGEYDQRRDPVTAGVPAVLPPLPEGAPANRLGFAMWLTRDDHPLFGRVSVNRFWQEVFGTGLVRTAGDFGIAGEQPSHPELLDWLAVSFRQNGWDVRELFRQIVTSATYRQAATLTAEKREKDPENRLLARGPRFRMDAEVLRDSALDFAGLLSPKVGGPSVRPYQPEGVWEAVAMPESNTKKYVPDEGDALYRRSLYTFWKRAAPPASMEILNAPNREVCTVQRERTNTPLQALVTLNDPQFVEAARGLAQRTFREAGPDTVARVEAISARVLARPFRFEEAKVVLGSLNRLLEYYKANPEEAAKLVAVGELPADPGADPAELAAWTMLCNQLMNLDEALAK